MSNLIAPNLAPGVYSIVVTVTDGLGATDTKSFTLTVSAAPAAVPLYSIAPQPYLGKINVVDLSGVEHQIAETTKTHIKDLSKACLLTVSGYPSGTVLAANSDYTAIDYFGQTTAPKFFHQVGTDGREGIWALSHTVGSTHYYFYAPVAAIQGIGSPIGTVTPDGKNQLYQDTATGIVYRWIGSDTEIPLDDQRWYQTNCPLPSYPAIDPCNEFEFNEFLWNTPEKLATDGAIYITPSSILQQQANAWVLYSYAWQAEGVPTETYRPNGARQLNILNGDTWEWDGSSWFNACSVGIDNDNYYYSS